jgi:hypothetical protein
MARLLNVRYTIRRADKPSSEQPVFSDGVWCVYENPDVGERAWVVHRIEIDQSSDDRPLKRLSDPDFDPARVAILDRAPLETIDDRGEGATDSVETVHYDPTSIEFRVQSNGRGMLVLSEVYYPGWEAYVNGQTAPIYRVNGFMRGVTIPDGNSTVFFRYRPLTVRIGGVLSFAALAGTVVLGLGVFRRRKTRY